VVQQSGVGQANIERREFQLTGSRGIISNALVRGKGKNAQLSFQISAFTA
jgi:hypothetical protein